MFFCLVKPKRPGPSGAGDMDAGDVDAGAMVAGSRANGSAEDLARGFERAGWEVWDVQGGPQDEILICFGAARTAPELRSRIARRGATLAIGDARLDRIDGLDPANTPPLSDPMDALIAGYDARGTDLPAHCWGDIAAVLLPGSPSPSPEGHKGPSLLAFRDRLGIHPLYWRETPQALVITNLPAAFARVGGANGRLDREAIRDFSLFMAPWSTATFDRTTKVLAPGHALTLAPGAESPLITRYWRPEDIPIRRDLDGAAVLAETRRLVAQAMDRQVPKGGGLGLEVSGGLDSALVAAHVARLLKTDPERGKSLRVHPAAMANPEWALAELTATDRFKTADARPSVTRLLAELGLPAPHFADRIGSDLVERARQAMRTLAAPWLYYGDRSWLQDHFVERECGVVLTGEGGNEALSDSGAAAVFEDYDQGRLGRLFLRQYNRRPLRHWRQTALIAAKVVVTSLFPSQTNRVLRRQLRTPAANRERAILRFAGKGSTEGQEALRQRLRANDDRVLFQLHRRVRDQILHRLTGPFQRGLEGLTLQAAARGLDMRHPLLDGDLVTFCLSLPGEHFRMGDQRRGLARCVAEGLVPDFIRQPDGRTPQGIRVAKARFWEERAETIAYLKRVQSHPVIRDYFDIEEMIAFLEEAKESPLTRTDGDHISWAVLMVAMVIIVGLEEMA